MPVTKIELEDSLRQLRRIEAHREVGAEKQIRKIYKDLVKDIKQFIGYEYAELAEDGKLTYEILQQKGEYARFLEEVEMRLENASPKIAKEVRDLVGQTYEAEYNGLQDAVAKATTNTELHAEMYGLRAATPEQIKSIIQKGLVDEVLKKNWQDNIYQIKREIAVGLSHGDSVKTMADRLTKQIDASYQRATLIARTESHRAREAGVQDSAMNINDTLKQGVTDVRMVKIWKTMKDEKVRPNVRRKTKKGWVTYKSNNGADHKSMEGVMVPVDELFEFSDGTTTMAPLQSGVAKHDCNCRCRTSLKLMSDAEYFKETGKHFEA